MERITFYFVHPGMDFRNLIFGSEVLSSLTTVKQTTDTTTKATEPLYQRLVRYLRRVAVDVVQILPRGQRIGFRRVRRLCVGDVFRVVLD